MADATHLNGFAENEFDVSIITLALHQFPPEMYSMVLSEMKRVSNRLIVLDYAIPLPWNFTGWGSRFAEFLAGREHHRNFKKYSNVGGLNPILTSNGLIITESDFMAKGAFQLVVACVPELIHP